MGGCCGGGGSSDSKPVESGLAKRPDAVVATRREEGEEPCCAKKPKTVPNVVNASPAGGCCGPQANACIPGACGPPNGAQDMSGVVDGVKEYYGETLKSTKDLKTSACTACERPHKKIEDIISKIPHAVVSKFYGCGFPTPLGIEGMRVLDLGCGSGRDCYIASALVGESGTVTGVDMTENQLQTAKDCAEEYATGTLGYAKSNMTFLKGYIEDLTGLGVEPNSIDLIISNCVVNLSVNKEKVLQELHTVLASGGEFQFSDVFCDQILPEHIQKHKVLVGECLGGAMEENMFLDLAAKTGFAKPQLVSKTPIQIHDQELKALLGSAQFSSNTYRLFKIPKELRSSCCAKMEVSYNGTFDPCTTIYKLNQDVSFEAEKKVVVKGTIADILTQTWLKKFFNKH